MMDKIRRMTERVEPGYARRWIRRNWWRCLAFPAWLTAGILIREIVAATRAESWQVGSEIIPSLACWVMAARVAAGEESPAIFGRARRGRNSNAAHAPEKDGGGAEE